MWKTIEKKKIGHYNKKEKKTAVDENDTYRYRKCSYMWGNINKCLGLGL